MENSYLKTEDFVRKLRKYEGMLISLRLRGGMEVFAALVSVSDSTVTFKGVHYRPVSIPISEIDGFTRLRTWWNQK